MPHLNSIRNGWQGENIAKFLLSKFSFIANPSTIADDAGSDFFCTLFKIENNGLHPHSSFAIQIKINDSNIEITNKKSYLEKLEIPFFVGIINIEKLKLTIYAGEYICDYFSSSELAGVKKIYIKLIEKRREPPLKMFEKSKNGEKSYILFPKVLEIDATYDYAKEPEKVKDLFDICRLMQENISSKTSNEYIFRKFKNDYAYIYTGSTSIQHFRENFLKRLAEVFFNLRWQLSADPSSTETIKKEFEIYKKLYIDLARIKYGLPGYLVKGFNELDKLLEKGKDK